ncbi:MAG: hypothetical protein HN742_38010 [Lentisphaerae bacterium]|jgi:regulation of enolase protein 1 (concanavalin A-like superfamily)|nr:hypothetical protein [Lentisphaerota bacterium]MBT4817201.1 hypothetical protein [Lentisphaerota bacterium]MBT5608098.1 hypothetical protein [Lentisphaerota bacterium]MBT7060625.1 hypothetical protein [Lentisphaerota bacterium]MBT7847724.1 hypothetical protein [Lentisphaerota bacterium]
MSVHRCKPTMLAVLALGGLCSVRGSAAPPVQEERPGQFQSTALGTPSLAGNAEVKPSGKGMTITAAGTDIWDREDEGHFVFRRLSGDAVVVVRIESLIRTDEWAKGGIMFREDLSPDSRHVSLLYTPRPLAAFQHRPDKGGITSTKHIEGVAAPAWLKVERFGRRFSAWVSGSGVRWRRVGHADLELPHELCVGLVVSSHNAGKYTTAVFSDVAIRPILNLAVPLDVAPTMGE